jgi:hypothetical protein
VIAGCGNATSSDAPARADPETRTLVVVAKSQAEKFARALSTGDIDAALAMTGPVVIHNTCEDNRRSRTIGGFYASGTSLRDLVACLAAGPVGRIDAVSHETTMSDITRQFPRRYHALAMILAAGATDHAFIKLHRTTCAEDRKPEDSCMNWSFYFAVDATGHLDWIVEGDGAFIN